MAEGERRPASNVHPASEKRLGSSYAALRRRRASIIETDATSALKLPSATLKSCSSPLCGGQRSPPRKPAPTTSHRSGLRHPAVKRHLHRKWVTGDWKNVTDHSSVDSQSLEMGDAAPNSVPPSPVPGELGAFEPLARAIFGSISVKDRETEAYTLLSRQKHL